MENKTASKAEGVGQIISKNLFRLPFFVGRGIKYYAAGRIYIPKPIIFSLEVTYRCISRCVMCSIWRKKPGREPTLGEIREIFSNPVLSRLETVILTGGEPTLREDLAQIAQTILDSNPGIKELQVITNGLEPSLVERRVKAILNLPAYSRLKRFALEVSLDGYGDTHEAIRRVPRAFDKVNETIKVLKRLQRSFPFSILLLCTVQKLNVSNLPQVAKFAQEMELPISFSPVGQRSGNEDVFEAHLIPSPDQLRELKDFFNDQTKHNIRLSNIAFWEDYFRIIQGEKRRFPCALPYHSIVMTPGGDLSICGSGTQKGPLVYGNVYESSIDKIWYSDKAEEVRKRLIKYICPTCTSKDNAQFSLSHDLFYLAKFLLGEISKGRVKRYKSLFGARYLS